MKKNNTYEVYVKANTGGFIVDVNSSAFLPDLTGWVEIDRGTGDKYHHAQGNYFPRPLYTDSGVYRYKLVDGQPVECSPEEIAKQEAELPPPTPSGSAEIEQLDNAYREGVNSL